MTEDSYYEPSSNNKNLILSKKRTVKIYDRLKQDRNR